MYTKGDLQVGETFEGDGIYLPHSCDEWVIGGRAEAEALIEDLQEAIKKLPS